MPLTVAYASILRAANRPSGVTKEARHIDDWMRLEALEWRGLVRRSWGGVYRTTGSGRAALVTVDAPNTEADLDAGQTIAALMLIAVQAARKAGHTRHEMERWYEQAMTLWEMPPK